MATQAQTLAGSQEAPAGIWKVIGSSAVGTVIEWYDFYIYGSLAAITAPIFFPNTDPTTALLANLATFGAGFAARPFGSLVFGRIGDMVGRKYAFLLTLLIMGAATFLVGLLPGYDTIGILAPIILVLLRIVQGLALGGEYGGAAVYVSEHVPDSKRGFYTSFIQTTATLGLFVSLLVVLGVRLSMTPADFAAWGWRIPFLASVVLVGLSLYIRLSLRESPLFSKLKSEGKTSSAPIKESFGNRANWKIILTVLFGAAAGQAVVWYTGQFYVLSWMQSAAVGIDFITANTMVAVALALATPFFIVFGALSDRIGRKGIMMAGNIIAVICTFPIFWAIKQAAGPLTERIGADGAVVLNAAGKPVMTAATPNVVAITLLVFCLVIFVTLVYGPIAAFLVESFPARIRYTSVSLPYHVGNGYFGGFLPLIATSLVASTGNIYAGLAFPIIVALSTFIIGSLLLRETKDVSIYTETGNVETAK
ncbi:MAG: MHS family MFS transporter [Chloroflexales bacterium]|nr:MHS family MFS transporter [Chloroflexales bacterium]